MLNQENLLNDCIARMVRDLENLFVIRKSRFTTNMYEYHVPANDNKRIMLIIANNGGISNGAHY